MASQGATDLVERLCAFRNRGAGTDAERRASEWVATVLRARGRRAEVEPIHVHPDWPRAIALHCVLGWIGSVLAITVPVAGFALVLLAATSLYLDLNARAYLLRSLFFRRASQNVVAAGGRPDAAERVVICAGIDAPRTGALNAPRARRLFARLSRLSALPFTPTRIAFWSLAFLVPLLAARAAGLDSDGIAVLQVIPTLLLLGSSFMFAGLGSARLSPGAVTDAAAVAVALSSVAELDRDPPRSLDVWVAVCGGSDALAEGPRALARSHPELAGPGTAFLCLDSIGTGSLRYVRAEGAAASFPADRRLLETCDSIAEAHREAGDGLDAAPLLRGDTRAAQALRVARRRAISITAVDAGGREPLVSRTPADVPAAVDAQALARAERFVVEVVRSLDRDAARSAPDAAAEPQPVGAGGG